MNFKFYGIHIIAELYEINNHKFTNKEKIISAVELGIKKSGATLIKTLYYSFENGGFSLLSLLKESHVSLHAYSEYSSIFMDVFTCGKINGLIIVDEINKYFSPKRTIINTIERGH